ncbi:15171_t:CDS:2 [Rhizophagus irregularis]|nr:15171_t:CDS:2 [Rhizophagus irregularis]
MAVYGEILKSKRIVQPIQVYSNQVPLVPQRTGFNLVQQPQIHWIPIQRGTDPGTTTLLATTRFLASSSAWPSCSTASFGQDGYWEIGKGEVRGENI